MSRLLSLVYQGRPDSLLWRRSLIPSTSLYFLNSCGDLVSEKAEEGRIQQFGANAFRTTKANLIIRQDLPEIVAAALSDRTRRLVYLLDDNVGAYASDAGLPPGYQKRLDERWRTTFLPLLRRAGRIVVCSGYLEQHLSQYSTTVRANPVWEAGLLEGLADRLAVPASPGMVQVAYLGTGSHQAEMAFLMPVLLHLLRGRDDVVLTLPAGSQWPAEIADHPRVQMRWPVPWFQYAAQLAGERYDVCLYPALDTPFAAGRSHNKVTEQALTGAFGLFSSTWSHASLVRDSGAGALVQNTAEEWIEAADRAIAGLPAWCGNAMRVAGAIRAMNDPAEQRGMWRALLGLEGGA